MSVNFGHSAVSSAQLASIETGINLMQFMLLKFSREASFNFITTLSNTSRTTRQFRTWWNSKVLVVPRNKLLLARWEHGASNFAELLAVFIWKKYSFEKNQVYIRRCCINKNQVRMIFVICAMAFLAMAFLAAIEVQTVSYHTQ